MKKVMLAVHLDTFFTGLIDIGRIARDSERYDPFFFFAQFYPGIPRDIKLCEAEGLPHIIADTVSRKLPDESLSLEKMQLSLGKRLRIFATRFFPQAIRREIKDWIVNSAVYQAWKLNHRLRYIRNVICQQGVSLMVLGGDIVHYDTAVYIRAAHLEHIPAVVAAGWMVHQDENAEAFMYDQNIHLGHGMNRLAGWLYPKWIYQYKGIALLRLPFGHIIAREWLKLAPPLPWTLHSGYADVITVKSDGMYQTCVKEGLPPEQLVFTGSVTFDRMANLLKDSSQHRANLYHRLGLPPDRPMILSAIPPNELYRIGGRPECDFSTYPGLVEFWVKSLAAVKDWNIIICLHPSLQYEDLKYIEDWGVKIARDLTANLVPLCELYVASISTTIEWATACGKPVINYDVYRYRQSDYVNIKGMVTMEEKDQYQSALARFTQDLDYYQKMVLLQTECR